MNAKTIKITYWILISLFCLMFLADIYGGFTQQKMGQDMIVHLGYPLYIILMSAVAKLVGIIILFQNKYKTIKEWAFAGFVLDFIFAFWSHMAVGDGAKDFMPPVILLVYILTTYYFWKKYNALPAEA